MPIEIQRVLLPELHLRFFNLDGDNSYKNGDIIHLEIDLSYKAKISVDFSEVDTDFDSSRVKIELKDPHNYIYEIVYTLNSVKDGYNLPVAIKIEDLTGVGFNIDSSFKINPPRPIISIIYPKDGEIISEKRPTIRTQIISPVGAEISISSIIMTLDNSIISYDTVVSPDGSSVGISYTPLEDLGGGEHAVTMEGRDINGLSAESKKSDFVIVATDLNANIIVHCHNPEGKEINSIEKVDKMVEIYDGDIFIGYGAHDLATHNKPINISAGIHTIKAKFNGMIQEQAIDIEPQQTKIITFTFNREDITDDTLSGGSSRGENEWIYQLIPAQDREFTYWFIQFKNSTQHSMYWKGIDGHLLLGYNSTNGNYFLGKQPSNQWDAYGFTWVGWGMWKKINPPETLSDYKCGSVPYDLLGNAV